MHIFYLHFQHAVIFATHSQGFNQLAWVCNKRCRWLQFCFQGAKTFGQ